MRLLRIFGPAAALATAALLGVGAVPAAANGPGLAVIQATATLFNGDPGSGSGGLTGCSEGISVTAGLLICKPVLGPNNTNGSYTYLETCPAGAEGFASGLINIQTDQRYFYWIHVGLSFILLTDLVPYGNPGNSSLHATGAGAGIYLPTSVPGSGCIGNPAMNVELLAVGTWA